jgi:oligosaccharide repeat unit polymerase
MIYWDKCLALLFSLLIFGQAFLIRRIVGIWVFPACIFSIFWFGFTFIPLLLLFYVPIEPLSIAYVLVCNIAFSLGSLSFDWKHARKRNKLKSHIELSIFYSNYFIVSSLYLITALSLLFVLINSIIQRISLHDIFFDLFASAAKYAQMRSSEEIKINIFGQLSIVFSYLGAALGGLVFSNANTKKRRIFILIVSFIPSIFVAIVQSAKGELFLSIGLFYAALLICRIYANDFYIFKNITLKSFFAYSIPAVLVLAVSFMTRGLYNISDKEYVLDMLLSNFISYGLSHIYAFSDWFAYRIGHPSQLNYTKESASYGFYTFMALFKLFGSSKSIPPGTYGEYLSYGDLFTTNIYTMFRGLINDFGITGSVVYMYITSYVFHFSFYAMMVNIKPVLSVAIFIIMVSYFIHSFLISIFMYNNIYVTFVMIWWILLLNKTIYTSKRNMFKVV